MRKPASNGKVQTKPCKICAESINQAAYVCTHCGNYQNWRRHLGMSQTVLALLTALISVATVFLPIAKETLTPAESRLGFSIQAIQPRQITILVSNSGSRPGSIRGGRLNVLDGSNPIAQSFSLVDLRLFVPKTPETDGGQTAAKIIEPGKSELVVLSTAGDLIASKYSNAGNKLSGTLNVSVTDFQGNQTVTENITVDSTDLKIFLGVMTARF